MAESKAPGLILVIADIGPDVEAEYSEWYRTVHIPERLSVPGMRSGRRFRTVRDNPLPNRLADPNGPDQLPRDPAWQTFLTVFEADSPEVEDHPVYRGMRGQRDATQQRVGHQTKTHLRAVFTQVFPTGAEWAPPPDGVGGIFLVGLSPDPAYEEEFNDWYNTERVPVFMQVPGLLRIRRFSLPGEIPRYLTFYELSDPSVVTTEAWYEATKSPWSRRMVPHTSSWFRATAVPQYVITA